MDFYVFPFMSEKRSPQHVVGREEEKMCLKHSNLTRGFDDKLDTGTDTIFCFDFLELFSLFLCLNNVCLQSPFTDIIPLREPDTTF
jgi:hypothetical protein